MATSPKLKSFEFKSLRSKKFQPLSLTKGKLTNQAHLMFIQTPNLRDSCPILWMFAHGRDMDATYKINAGCNCRMPKQASMDGISALHKIGLLPLFNKWSFDNIG